MQSDNSSCVIGSVSDPSKGNTSPGGAGVYVDNNGTAFITNVTFGYNNATSSGGALYVKHSSATTTGVTFTYNTAKYGGAIIIYGAEVDVNSNTFSSNTSTSGIGGAIYVRGGDEDISPNSTVNIDSSIFQENDSQGTGGAIYINTNSSVDILNSSFDSNTATTDGGAIYSLSELTIQNCSFVSNSAGKDGGALFIQNSACHFISGSLHGNIAVSNGGAIALYSSSTLNIDSITATGNTANLGGVFYVNRSNLNIITNLEETIVFGTTNASQADELANSATSKGGVIYSTIGGNVTIKGAVFSYNHSANGGAIAGSHASGCTISITNSSFVGNSSSSNGGAIYGEGASSFTIQGSTFSYNVAQCGAAIYGKESSVFELSNCVFSNNSSNGSGGAISIYGSSKMTVNGCNFISNTAKTTGGAILSVDHFLVIWIANLIDSL